jgi:hypothetical protein
MRENEAMETPKKRGERVSYEESKLPENAAQPVRAGMHRFSACSRESGADRAYLCVRNADCKRFLPAGSKPASFAVISGVIATLCSLAANISR